MQHEWELGEEWRVDGMEREGIRREQGRRWEITHQCMTFPVLGAVHA
jgi:hypothetical protein